MADIDIRRVHTLGLAGARVAADKMAEELGRKFDLRGAWKGNVLHFERPGVQGTLAIEEKALHLTVSLGFLLKAMKGSIERAVTGELDELFAERGPAASAKSDPKVKPAEPKTKTAKAPPKKDA